MAFLRTDTSRVVPVGAAKADTPGEGKAKYDFIESTIKIPPAASPGTQMVIGGISKIDRRFADVSKMSIRNAVFLEKIADNLQGFSAGARAEMAAERRYGRFGGPTGWPEKGDKAKGGFPWWLLLLLPFLMGGDTEGEGSPVTMAVTPFTRRKGGRRGRVFKGAGRRKLSTSRFRPDRESTERRRLVEERNRIREIERARAEERRKAAKVRADRESTERRRVIEERNRIRADERRLAEERRKAAKFRPDRESTERQRLVEERNRLRAEERRLAEERKRPSDYRPDRESTERQRVIEERRLRARIAELEVKLKVKPTTIIKEVPGPERIVRVTTAEARLEITKEIDKAQQDKRIAQNEAKRLGAELRAERHAKNQRTIEITEANKRTKAQQKAAQDRIKALEGELQRNINAQKGEEARRALVERQRAAAHAARIQALRAQLADVKAETKRLIQRAGIEATKLDAKNTKLNQLKLKLAQLEIDNTKKNIEAERKAERVALRHAEDIRVAQEKMQGLDETRITNEKLLTENKIARAGLESSISDLQRAIKSNNAKIAELNAEAAKGDIANTKRIQGNIDKLNNANEKIRAQQRSLNSQAELLADTNRKLVTLQRDLAIQQGSEQFKITEIQNRARAEIEAIKNENIKSLADAEVRATTTNTQVRELQRTTAQLTAEVEGLITEAEIKAEADRVATEAKAEADRVVTEAKAEADRAEIEAKAEADRVVTEARVEADRVAHDPRSKVSFMAAVDAARGPVTYGVPEVPRPAPMKVDQRSLAAQTEIHRREMIEAKDRLLQRELFERGRITLGEVKGLQIEVPFTRYSVGGKATTFRFAGQMWEYLTQKGLWQTVDSPTGRALTTTWVNYVEGVKYPGGETGPLEGMTVEKDPTGRSEARKRIDKKLAAGKTVGETPLTIRKGGRPVYATDPAHIDRGKLKIVRKAAGATAILAPIIIFHEMLEAWAKFSASEKTPADQQALKRKFGQTLRGVVTGTMMIIIAFEMGMILAKGVIGATIPMTGGASAAFLIVLSGFVAAWSIEDAVHSVVNQVTKAGKIWYDLYDVLNSNPLTQPIVRLMELAFEKSIGRLWGYKAGQDDTSLGVKVGFWLADMLMKEDIIAEFDGDRAAAVEAGKLERETPGDKVLRLTLGPLRRMIMNKMRTALKYPGTGGFYLGELGKDINFWDRKIYGMGEEALSATQKAGQEFFARQLWKTGRTGDQVFRLQFSSDKWPKDGVWIGKGGRPYRSRQDAINGVNAIRNIEDPSLKFDDPSGLPSAPTADQAEATRVNLLAQKRVEDAKEKLKQAETDVGQLTTQEQVLEAEEEHLRTALKGTDPFAIEQVQNQLQEIDIQLEKKRDDLLKLQQDLTTAKAKVDRSEQKETMRQWYQSESAQGIMSKEKRFGEFAPPLGTKGYDPDRTGAQTKDPTEGEAATDPNLLGNTQFSSASLADSIRGQRSADNIQTDPSVIQTDPAIIETPDTQPVQAVMQNNPVFIDNFGELTSNVTLNMGSATETNLIESAIIVETGGESSAGNKLTPRGSYSAVS